MKKIMLKLKLFVPSILFLVFYIFGYCLLDIGVNKLYVQDMDKIIKNRLMGISFIVITYFLLGILISFVSTKTKPNSIFANIIEFIIIDGVSIYLIIFSFTMFYSSNVPMELLEKSPHISIIGAIVFGLEFVRSIRSIYLKKIK